MSQLPSGYKLDDGLPEGYSIDEPPSRSRRAISGVNRGYAAMLGAPADLVAGALNYAAPGYRPTVAQPITNPAFGSQMIGDAFRAGGVDLDQPRDIWGMAGEYFAPVPIAGPLNAALSPTKGPMTRAATRLLGNRAGPVVGATARESVAAGAALAGGAAGQQVADKLGVDSPFYEMAGAIIPSALASGISGVPRWLARGRQGNPFSASPTMERRIAELDAQGVPATPGLATGDPLQATKEAKLASSPGAYEVYRETGKQADKAFEASNQRIAGGANTSIDSAGDAMKSGLLGKGGWYDRWKAKKNELYNALDAKIGPRTPVISTNTQQFFDDYTAVDPQAPALSAGEKNSLVSKFAEDYYADTTANLGQLPYERLKNLRTRVGQALEISDNSVIGSADRAALSRLYGAISDDMREVARVSGATKEFKAANRFYHQGANRAEVWLDNLNKKVKPEDFWKATIGDSPQSATQLRAYRQMLKPDEWDYMVQTVMNRWGRAQPNARTIEHDFSMGRWYTNWNNAPDEVRTTLFGKKGTPKRDAVELMANNIDKYREQNQILFNPSGSGALGLGASAQFGAAGGVGAGVLSYLTGANTAPEMLTAMAAGTYGGIQSATAIQANTAKLFTNQKFVKWLAQGMEMPMERAPAHLMRLYAISQKDSDLEGPAREIIRGMDPAVYERLYGGGR